MRVPMLALVLLSTLPAVPASAFCQYHGVMYAKTTVAQEFRDSRLVVRARVLSAENRSSDYPTPAYRKRWGDSWSVVRYRLAVERLFKGEAGREIVYFTERNSGAFYMDDGMRPDIGASYLLFLNPVRRYRGMPTAAIGAWDANYPCGQSMRWDQVRRADIATLMRISGAR